MHIFNGSSLPVTVTLHPLALSALGPKLTYSTHPLPHLPHWAILCPPPRQFPHPHCPPRFLPLVSPRLPTRRI
jgi:hypothetical protein